MSDPYFFGYGSLVNARTHDYRDLAPARLDGWRREWCTTRLRPVAFLSARPVAGGSIAGAIAAVPGADWRRLDAREAAYDRHDVTGAVDHAAPEARHIAVYSVRGDLRQSRRGAILLSYLDVVADGMLRMHGTAGVADFFATTDGWRRPVLNDRKVPVYRRHRRVDVAVRRMVDRHLDGLAAVVEELDQTDLG